MPDGSRTDRTRNDADDLVTGEVLLNQALSKRSPSAIAILVTALADEQALPNVRHLFADAPDGPNLRTMMKVLADLGYELRVTPLGSDKSKLSSDWLKLIS